MDPDAELLTELLRRVIRIEGMMGELIAALADDDEAPPLRTLDGKLDGGPRDETRPL